MASVVSPVRQSSLLPKGTTPQRSSFANKSDGNNVSYEKFAPRSTSQVNRLSKIAALTAGPTSRSSTSSSPSAVSETTSRNKLIKAMSPLPNPSDEYSTSTSVAVDDGDGEQAANSPTEDPVRATLSQALSIGDTLTNQLKHTTSVRLALRASINIAEDISNRHADLIRHSGELSAAADRLQEEETILTRHAEEIGMPLQHYDSVDRIGLQVGVLFKGKTTVRGLAKIKVDNDDYPDILDQIDDAVDYFARESGGKEALEAEMKRRASTSKSGKTSQLMSGNVEYYRRALALQEAALFLIKEAVAERISNTTNQIASALNIPNVPVAADQLEASLIYTRFHGISSRSNRLVQLLKARLNRSESHSELLQLCRSTYFTCRESLLRTTVRAHMDKLKEQHGPVGMTRLASVFLSRLCTVETSLYLDFFGDKKKTEEQQASKNEDGSSNSKKTTLASQGAADDGTFRDSEFQAYLTSLCSALHRTVRRSLVTMQDLDTLCQIVSVLREERSMASSTPTTVAAARAISNVIQDAQERLIYCANTTLTKQVIKFKATPADLDYPDKLKHKEDSSIQDKEDSVEKRLEQVYESWFPPMRSVLKILSKIFRVVEPRVFEEMALEAVQACTKSLKDGAAYIKQRKGIVHSDLFMVKHMLILREQLSPFDIELRSVERQLDFSDAGKAVARFLKNRNRRLFSMSTENALVSLLREGVSVQESSVDSKRDLEDALRSACNEFIENTVKSVAGDLIEMVENCKVSTNSESSSTKLSADSVESSLAKTAGGLEESMGEVTSQMGLYLDNPATQSILLKPVTRKITRALDDLRRLIKNNTKDGESGWDGVKRAQVDGLMEAIDQVLKRATSKSSSTSTTTVS